MTQQLSNNTAVIRQIARKEGALSGAYYQLTRPDGTTIGAVVRGDLTEYARQNGWEIEYVPLPPKPRGVVHGFGKNGDWS